jgi:hypothetical protein
LKRETTSIIGEQHEEKPKRRGKEDEEISEI